MAEITVTRIGETTFQVGVQEGAIRTIHHVTATPADVQRYGAGAFVERLIKASFEFLLEREPPGRSASWRAWGGWVKKGSHLVRVCPPGHRALFPRVRTALKAHS